MRAGTRGGMVTHGLVLCVLAFALLGMHHVTSPSHLPAAHGSSAMSAVHGEMSVQVRADSHTTPSDPGHDALHLCLAVLIGAGALILLARAPGFGLENLRRFLPDLTRAIPIPIPGRRPPGIAGRSLLTAVCVLRV